VFRHVFPSPAFAAGSQFCRSQNALEWISAISFSTDDLAYLSSLGTFRKEFLEMLATSISEAISGHGGGTLAFPGEPLVRVHATLIEAQLIESALLAILNFRR